MTTIKKCSWEQCSIKILCKRFRCKINPYKQDWLKSDYTIGKGCKNFIDNNEKDG